ncbi:MAG TPA: hypothetical protein VFA94_01210 [Acidimicrobiales bacterium]|nr:hypothetical protein [Acidimicrobiales bacterium]
MRRWGIVLVVIALLGAGCGGGKGKNAGKASAAGSSSPATTATTGPVTPNAGTGGASGGGSATTGGINSTGATAPTRAGGATATTAKATPGGSTGAGSGANASANANSGDAGNATNAAHAAAPGRYTYNRTGSANSSAFGQQSLDGQVPLQVDPASGTDQHSIVNPGGSTSVEQTLRFLSDGAYFTQIKQSTSGFAKEFRPDPPVLAVPANAANGRSWQWSTTSTDGATTLNGSFTAVRHETLTVGGQAVDCLLLDVVLKTSGDVTSTSTQKVWMSYRYGLIVRQQETTDGTLGSVTFHSTSDQILQSVTPQ